MHIVRVHQRFHAAGRDDADTSCGRCRCPILLIEDQRSIATMLAAVIKDRYGYETVIAGTLQETTQIVESRPIHLAIADLNLPDAPHGEVIDLLSKHKISTIALTGVFGREMRDAILKKGAIDYIPKQSPHAIEYAVEMVDRIYRNHHIDVLVVDDSLSARALLKHLLEAMQLNVIVAGDAQEALSILESRPNIRLVLVDYEMPGMNGFELIHEIRRHFSKEELAIIGISASEDGAMSAQFLKSGANDFVRKPFTYEEILCRIGQNLEVLELIRGNLEAAYRDHLTGLYNRRYFFKEGERLHRQAFESNELIAVILDADHFKAINDTYGHDCGDQVLIKLAQLLSQHFGHHLVARLGGEEFAVILQNVTGEQAFALCEVFRRAVENSAVQYGDQVVRYTVSIGLSDERGGSLDEFLLAADRQLYAAKSGGRNRVEGSASAKAE